MKKLALTLVTLFAASAFLAGCGGDDDGGTAELVSNQDLTAPVSAANVNAIAGDTFTFPNGVTSLGTVTSTDVRLNTSTFTVSTGTSTASGTLGFGSCILTVTSSNFLPPSPLANGQTVTINPCNLQVDTSGIKASENAVARAVSFILGGNASLAKTYQVDINGSGVVTINGDTVGTVTLTVTTGGTGGSSN